MVTEAVGFVLAGQGEQAESQATEQTLHDYISFLALLAKHSSPEKQLQLLRVNQIVLKQGAQIMQGSADFQQSILKLLQQLLQVCLNSVSNFVPLNITVKVTCPPSCH